MKDIIQVAGVIDRNEAALLMEAGVDYLGFPLRLPVNRVDHTEAEAAAIIKGISGSAKAVLICYEQDADEIITLLDFLGTAVVQLHGPITVEALQQLKEKRPDITIFKSVVIGEGSMDQLISLIHRLEPYVDAFITDTFDPVTGASGATGLTHDWSISREIVLQSSQPVILAGGLNADNVFDAVCQVKPAGVDVHTGIEGGDGRKDLQLTHGFVSEARRAFSIVADEVATTS